ncbi:DUF4865 family protein [Rhizobium sp. XQZ8]|uniref:DUF4865 family protein n=1 Tax=Rhizobium populisoli TaxID=2859785 RepID=UPI001C6716E7|nr:DUF4865 family protein [Rhizobium populisoli]MBW6425565.1 DUF4865 family protein [Rhizobium populisoli]
MIAMQYSFPLPADYDMSIIDRRISDNGHRLDGFPDLRFKAYLSARTGEMQSPENLYAPFYLWERAAGMEAFLSGPGFRAVSSAFGWPSVASWLVWHQDVSMDVAAAGCAMKHILPIAPYCDLQALRCEATRRALEQTTMGALACVTGFDPRGWSLVEFSLWREPPTDQLPGQRYDVGYVAVESGYAGERWK